MGLKNSGQSFQRLLDSVIGDMKGVFCYLDDLLIYSKTQEEHLRILEELFSRLQLERGLVRNNDLRVPVLDTESTLERVPLSKSQNFAGSAELMEPILTRPLIGKTTHPA